MTHILTLFFPQDHKVDVEKLVGMRCRAPHHSKSTGAVTQSNAIIFHAEEGEEDVMLRVVFSHPTSTDMVPCQFYMESRCRFQEEECR